ncbi:MAG TPA: hypothetical protein VMV13_07430 [Candidatus Binataceae bacterium]|nr:hypothetical protein [Candidatus Binataceae bacterium]
MAYDIHPRSFGEILDLGFRIVRDNIILLAGIAAVVFIPLAVLQIISSSAASGLIGLLFLLIVAPVMQAALTVAIANVYLGTPITIDEAYRSVKPILAPYLGTFLLIYLLIVLGFVCLIIPGFYFMIGWSLAAQVMIIERRFGMESMSRSRALVRGAWWATFGIALAASVISEVPTLALTALWSFIPFLGPLLTGATRSVSATYLAAVMVIYYFDRRCRVEDFDLRLLAEQIRSEGQSGPLPSAGVSTVA